MFDVFVAFRFLREGRAQTLLILTGIVLGIAVQVFLNSLIVGLQASLVERTVGNAPHITGTMPDLEPSPLVPAGNGARTISRVVTNEGAVKPIRDGQTVVSQLEKLGIFTVILPVARGSGFVLQGQKSLPVILRGADLEGADRLYDIRRRMTAGRYEVGAENALIGKDLAEKLRLGVGSAIRVSTPGGADELFRVNGIFDLENQAVNESWILLSLPRVQNLFDVDRGLTEIEIQVDDVFAAERSAADLRAGFPSLRWRSWEETNASLLTALQSQGSSSYMIQLFVLLSVTLGIASVLAVSVVQKSRQIGILKAIGTLTRHVGRIFVIQGAVLGFVGSLLGVLAGWGLIQMFQAVRAGDPSSFPISISFGAAALSVAVATAAGTLAAFFPARRAARLNPIEVIRNG
ncbi:MAG: ABC transporter permease [Candidatus Aminicenantes bacterium]|nr:ABC transporter permease [Candidatus Aminicenantes bacterium]